MARVTLEAGLFGWDYILRHEDGRSILVQLDYDYPRVASNLGWTPRCGCRSTDGTVNCEHHTAGEHIADAEAFFDEHIGDSFEDPGYFDDPDEDLLSELKGDS